MTWLSKIKWHKKFSLDLLINLKWIFGPKIFHINSFKNIEIQKSVSYWFIFVCLVLKEMLAYFYCFFFLLLDFMAKFYDYVIKLKYFYYRHFMPVCFLFQLSETIKTFYFSRSSFSTEISWKYKWNPCKVSLL